MLLSLPLLPGNLEVESAQNDSQPPPVSEALTQKADRVECKYSLLTAITNFSNYSQIHNK